MYSKFYEQVSLSKCVVSGDQILPLSCAAQQLRLKCKHSRTLRGYRDSASGHVTVAHLIARS